MPPNTASQWPILYAPIAWEMVVLTQIQLRNPVSSIVLETTIGSDESDTAAISEPDRR